MNKRLTTAIAALTLATATLNVAQAASDLFSHHNPSIVIEILDGDWRKSSMSAYNGNCVETGL